MAFVTGKMDELQAKVKAELADFLNNQNTLLSLQKPLDSMKSAKPAVYTALKARYDALYSKQSTLESQAMDWIKRIADLKTQILANPDISSAVDEGKITAAMFSGGFWKQVSAFTNQSIPLINEGISLSGALVTQNGDVSLFKKSVESGSVLVPSSSNKFLSVGMISLYGLLGVGLAYLMASKKRRA